MSTEKELNNGILYKREEFDDRSLDVEHIYTIPYSVINPMGHRFRIGERDIVWNPVPKTTFMERLYEHRFSFRGKDNITLEDKNIPYTCVTCGAQIFWDLREFKNPDYDGDYVVDFSTIGFLQYNRDARDFTPLERCQHVDNTPMSLTIDVGESGLLIGNDLRTHGDGRIERLFETDYYDLNSDRGYREYTSKTHDQFGVVNVKASNTLVSVYRHPDGSIGIYDITERDLKTYKEFLNSDDEDIDFENGEFKELIDMGLTPDHVLLNSEYIGYVSCDLWAVQMADYDHYVNGLGGQRVEDFNQYGSRHVVQHPAGHGQAKVTVNSVMSDYDTQFFEDKMYFGERIKSFKPTVPLAVIHWE